MKAFIVHPEDNVATALESIHPGKVSLLGRKDGDSVVARDKIAIGHKIALCDIETGNDILKYKISIGRATDSIQSGQWVHLHNCASHFDERSNTLDVKSGAPTEDNIYR